MIDVEDWEDAEVVSHSHLVLTASFAIVECFRWIV